MKYSAALCLLLALARGQDSGNSATHGGATADIPPSLASSSGTLAAPHYQADFTPIIADGRHWFSLDKGHLVSFGVGGTGEPVAVYDKTGKWLFEDALNFENAVKVYGHDAAATNLGTAVVAAAVLSHDGAFADLIVQVAKDGVRRTVRTNPFDSVKVCATDEGTVWAYGFEMDADRYPAPRAHYPMLREYSFEKGELRSALDRATVRPAKGSTLKGSGAELQMICTAGKVVIVNGVINEVEEYDLATSTLSRWPIAPLPAKFYINGAAVTDSGQIYVSVLKPGEKALTGILRLHLNSSGTVEWTPLTIIPPAPDFFYLLGNDGDDLVYSRGISAPTLFWSATGEAGGTK